MIQRVQSIYLLLVTVLMSFLLVRAYAELTLNADQLLTFRAHAIVSDIGSDTETIYKSTIPVIALVLITAILSFINIFIYRRRIIQIRICMVNTLLLVALLITIFLYYMVTKNSLTTIHQSFRIPAIFPLMGIVFNIMATRAIQRDELLVNSYKRIR